MQKQNSLKETIILSGARRRIYHWAIKTTRDDLAAEQDALDKMSQRRTLDDDEQLVTELDLSLDDDKLMSVLDDNPGILDHLFGFKF